MQMLNTKENAKAGGPRRRNRQVAYMPRRFAYKPSPFSTFCSRVMAFCERISPSGDGEIVFYFIAALVLLVMSAVHESVQRAS
jgi:hypothetical protein